VKNKDQDYIHRHIGGLENDVLKVINNHDYSPPHRRLRKTDKDVEGVAGHSPPHRRLRKIALLIL